METTFIFGINLLVAVTTTLRLISLQTTRPLKDYPRNSHHRHIAFLSAFEDAPLLTKTVKINQSEGIPGSGIPDRTFVKNSCKRSRSCLPSPSLLFIAFFTSHRSPLSELLEQPCKCLKAEEMCVDTNAISKNLAY